MRKGTGHTVTLLLSAPLLFASIHSMAAGRLTLEGTIEAPAEKGDQYSLKLLKPITFNGDPICGPNKQTTIDLWGEQNKIEAFVGKKVSVSGTLDCPRGGYVLRSIQFAASSNNTPSSVRPDALVGSWECMDAKTGAWQLLRLRADGGALTSRTGRYNGLPDDSNTSGGNYTFDGKTLIMKTASAASVRSGAPLWHVEEYIVDNVTPMRFTIASTNSISMCEQAKRK